MSDYWLGFLHAVAVVGTLGGVGGAVALLADAERRSRNRFRRVAQEIVDGLRDGTLTPDPPLAPPSAPAAASVVPS